MTNVDQFESVFRSAAKELYVQKPIEISRVLCLHDLEKEDSEALGASVRNFLAPLSQLQLELFSAVEIADIEALEAKVQERKPDLIVTYRGLRSSGWRHRKSLGERLEVLTQSTPFPVLVIPHPKAEESWIVHTPKPTGVMAITDHLVGETRLVDWAGLFAQAFDGKLLLAHIEDHAVFERYIDAISKIPSIDTELARESIEAQLLKEPRDWVESCRQALSGQANPVETRGIVRMGKRLEEVRGLIDENGIQLLVMNTKDHEQLAMHGLAYPLAVELRDIAILML